MSRRIHRRRDAEKVLARLGYRYEQDETRSSMPLASDRPAGAMPVKTNAPAGNTTIDEEEGGEE